VSILDVYVAKVHEYIDDMRGKGRPVTETDCPSSVGELQEGLPIRTGPGASSGLILRGDAFVELGNPAAGSCSFILWTDSVSPIRDGRITLIGPDIQESPGASLPFGQILMVGGAELTEKDQDALDHSQYVADQIEGYMIRSMPELIWSRVSREVGEKGFDLGMLGRALMALFKSEVPKIETMEIVFVTSDKEDLKPLEDISAQVRKIARSILVENWKARGFDLYECTLGWDCNACPDQPVCDEIKEFIQVRKTGNISAGSIDD
jgi:CO dehydrogenase/acetyl-CoA synthase beta subunit